MTAVLFLLGIQCPQIPGAPPRTPSSVPHRAHPSLKGSPSPPALLRASSRGSPRPRPAGTGLSPQQGLSLAPSRTLYSLEPPFW